MTVPASALDLRDGTWLMTGSCVMKDSAIVKENYGHSLDRLQVCFSWTVANWHSLMVNEPDEPRSGHVFLFFFFRKSSGEQLDSSMRWIYSLKHHTWRHTCGRNKKKWYRRGSLMSMTILPHFDVICDLSQNRPTTIWNLFRCFM